MGILIGPTPWWQQNVITVSPVGTILPDRSRIICKAGGIAWIVAPSTTEVSQTWNGTTTLLVGTKCCVCDWPTLNTCLIARGFNPSDWFVPSCAQLQNPGYVCRTQWDTVTTGRYWSSTEQNSAFAFMVCVSTNATGGCQKNNCSGGTFVVRAFRCVTY